mmetsp:Transcript_31225/g.75947  ORF Transcript_31225/g.75947 Transcript_31225/m.75947 type:complete len:311 (+) Transcript_31225:1364-2296(+)
MASSRTSTPIAAATTAAPRATCSAGRRIASSARSSASTATTTGPGRMGPRWRRPSRCISRCGTSSSPRCSPRGSAPPLTARRSSRAATCCGRSTRRPPPICSTSGSTTRWWRPSTTPPPTSPRATCGSRPASGRTLGTAPSSRGPPPSPSRSRTSECRCGTARTAAWSSRSTSRRCGSTSRSGARSPSTPSRRCVRSTPSHALCTPTAPAHKRECACVPLATAAACISRWTPPKMAPHVDGSSACSYRTNQEQGSPSSSGQQVWTARPCYPLTSRRMPKSPRPSAVRARPRRFRVVASSSLLCRHVLARA